MKGVKKEEMEGFEGMIEEVKKGKGVGVEKEVEVEEVKRVVVGFKEGVKKERGEELG